MHGSSRHLSLAVCAALLAACSSSESSTSRALEVAATVSPITNLVNNVGGDRVAVTGIVPEGTDSHTFEPAPSDAALLAEADIVFMNGLHLEEPTRELAEANVREGVAVIELGDRVLSEDEYIYDRSFPESEGDPNPHLWTSPVHAGDYARIVSEELAAIDPDHAHSYAANEEAFRARIAELDALVREVTESVPPENRKLLTYHDSFPYFAREYGWEVLGAVQPADFAEPTAQEVAALIDQIEQEGIPAIFGSEVFPSPVLEQIASEAGADYVDQLRDDDLPGENGDAEHSYFGLMVFDFRTFMGALGGDTSPFDGFDATNLQPGDTTTYRS